MSDDTVFKLIQPGTFTDQLTIGFADGARESAHDWRELLLDLKRRRLQGHPELAIADGALGFWKAAGEVWPATRGQRCWVHKSANVLAKLQKSQQPWMAETKVEAELGVRQAKDPRISTAHLIKTLEGVMYF